ncbi:cell wall hydrolase [Aureimonas altamirensis]|jgi:spore germination cell wall hydrolase CwlJ-like protein|uniref:Cell Wall Hydrolase n=1 Tax=Aureimonas altamirensis DSM 21988 TaxID=1121026 RepID=A0ABY1I3N9_9HYPH|nr:cell wall hydrolase [Aureimonas altamirensis]SHI56274.1 Cell Wall Hydrolase [Aureimonas altamirensis DSM 21988]
MRLGAPTLLLLSTIMLVSGCASVKQRTMSEHECMTRVMYFESNRSSEEGMVAVGTVVMNRKNSGRYPESVCGVVGQKNQFAPGVLTKPMGAGRDLAEATARKVLRGARHTGVGNNAMFFHTAGYSYPYNNMHYVAIAGGNAFYEKRKNPTQTQDMFTSRPSPRYSPRSIAASMAPAAPRPAPSAMTIEELIAQGGSY